MLPYQNFEIYAALTLFVIIKIVCAIVHKHRLVMFDRKGNLTSIPEYNESDDDIVKWVPKKKHEILKAKYKCLKKLFQIYDASVMGILPHDVPNEEQKVTEISHRRKRSHRTKTDACAGTTEISSGDVSLTTERTAATAVMKDLNLQTYALIDTSRTTLSNAVDKSDKSTQDSNEDLTNNKESECVQTSEPSPFPYVVINERRKPTRLQNFLNRIFGFKTERRYFPQTGVYAASDTNILNGYERRRRRALRFRRRRPKKIHSEIILRDVNTPMIMSYVQSVQKHCLMDKTPRQCPIVGCRMIFYGIINYNDHLNLYHFLDRKYICLYCHEGFTIEYDKIVHENDHIGISKIVAPTVRQSAKIASNTQTEPEPSGIDVPEEKLKKIVSFFDKISDCDRVIDQIKRHRYSESNLDTTNRSSTKSETDDAKPLDFRKRSDDNVKERRRYCSADSVSSSFPSQRFTCNFCGENFDFRRQLNHHMDLEHCVHDKFSKIHSCPGIANRKTGLTEGRINIRSEAVTAPSTCTEVSSTRSVTCDPSTNIVYYTSMESVMKKPSVVESLVQKIRSYKWESGSKVVRV